MPYGLGPHTFLISSASTLYSPNSLYHSYTRSLAVPQTHQICLRGFTLSDFSAWKDFSHMSTWPTSLVPFLKSYFLDETQPGHLLILHPPSLTHAFLNPLPLH